MYAEVAVVVDGAQESFDLFHDETHMADHIGQVEADAAGDGYKTEVYVLYHDHDDLGEGEECACAQYLTDHHPTHVFNAGDDD